MDSTDGYFRDEAGGNEKEAGRELIVKVWKIRKFANMILIF